MNKYPRAERFLQEHPEMSLNDAISFLNEQIKSELEKRKGKGKNDKQQF